MLFLHARSGAFSLRRCMFQRRTSRLLFEISLMGIVRVVPAVGAQTRSAQFKNTWHLIQQFAIVEKAKPALQGFTWIGWEHVGIAMVWLVAVAIALSMIPTLIATRRFLKV